MTIAAKLNSISQHRFVTYKSSVFNGARKEEYLGIYLWNKQLAGAFLTTGRLNAYRTGDRVTFEPENKTAGCHPVASAIKPA